MLKNMNTLGSGEKAEVCGVWETGTQSSPKFPHSLNQLRNGGLRLPWVLRRVWPAPQNGAGRGLSEKHVVVSISESGGNEDWGRGQKIGRQNYILWIFYGRKP